MAGGKPWERLFIVKDGELSMQVGRRQTGVGPFGLRIYEYARWQLGGTLKIMMPPEEYIGLCKANGKQP